MSEMLKCGYCARPYPYPQKKFKRCGEFCSPSCRDRYNRNAYARKFYHDNKEKITAKRLRQKQLKENMAKETT